MREHIWRTGARANLPTGWLPGAVGGGAFAVLEPPAAASPWVPQLLQQARAFRQKLDAADRLQEADRRQVRRAAVHTTAGRTRAWLFRFTGQPPWSLCVSRCELLPGQLMSVRSAGRRMPPDPRQSGSISWTGTSEAAGGLSAGPGVLQLWRHALAAIAEGVLAGFAGVSGRCTPMGRASMSLDLQQVTAGQPYAAADADMEAQR